MGHLVSPFRQRSSHAMDHATALSKLGFGVEMVEITSNNLELIGFGKRLDRYVQGTISARNKGERRNESPVDTPSPRVQLTIDGQTTPWMVCTPAQECCYCRSVLLVTCDEDIAPDGRSVARYLFARSHSPGHLELIPLMAVVTYDPKKSDIHQRSRFAHGELLRASVSF